MQEKIVKGIFLKQNLFVFAAVGLSWMVWSWLFRDFVELWALSTIFMLFYMPLTYLRFNRSKKGQDNKALNTATKVTLWIFFLLFLSPLPHILWYNLYSVPSLYSAYYPRPSLIADVARGLLDDISYNIYYFIIAGLLYLAIKSERQEELIKQTA